MRPRLHRHEVETIHTALTQYCHFVLKQLQQLEAERDRFLPSRQTQWLRKKERLTRLLQHVVETHAKINGHMRGRRGHLPSAMRHLMTITRRDFVGTYIPIKEALSILPLKDFVTDKLNISSVTEMVIKLLTHLGQVGVISFRVTDTKDQTKYVRKLDVLRLSAFLLSR